MREIADAAAESLRRHAVRLGSGPLLAAVSGGVDSTALALALARLHSDGALPGGAPWIAHVDHGQHAERRAAADAVRALASRLGLPHRERELALPAGASEARMRDARYGALAALARELGATAVVTAHHRDDQVETVLMRAMRGAGRRGLAGIPEWRPLGSGVGVWRPLLSVPKSLLAAAVLAERAPVVEDPTNADTHRLRAAVRHDLLPRLRDRAPIDDALHALAVATRARNEALERLARAWLASHARAPAPWRIELDTPAQLAPELRDEVLRLVHVAATGRAPLGAWLERAAALVAARTGCRLDAGLFAERTWDGLLFVDSPRAGTPPAAPVDLPVDGTVTAFGTTEWSLRATPGARVPIPADRSRGVVDAERAPLPFTLRAVRAADRFDAPGQPRPVALRDLMQRRRVPRFDRSRVPIVVDASDRPIWTPGVETAAFARIDATTRRPVALERIDPARGITLPEPSY